MSRRSGECKPYSGDDGNYIFVSYAHADKAKVRPILNVLYRVGFNIWFDDDGRGITTAAAWEDEIFENRLPNSSAFLCFVSQHNEFRGVVLKEMERGIQRADKEGDYKAVFVCLEKISTSSFPEACRDRLNKYQFINYSACGGLTDKFMVTMLSVSWPKRVIDSDAFKESMGSEWIGGKPGSLDYTNSVLIDADFATRAKFERSQSECIDDGGILKYYRTSPDQVNPNTVYVTCLDNQWVPELFYTEEIFRSKGLNEDSFVSETRTPLQRTELLRALLSNWQIIINRASMWNSTIFSDWFTGNSGSEEASAFASLAGEGVFIIFLTLEGSPLEKGRFSTNQFESWKAFCRKNPVTFLRFDWESEESNRYEVWKHLFNSFQDFCLSAVDDPILLEALSNALGIEEERRSEFTQAWREIQADVIAWSKAHEHEADRMVSCYSRERFYQQFLSKTGTEVKDGILDWEKPFTAELKKVVDFVYTTNLPRALQIQPVLPTDSPLRLSSISGSSFIQRQREVSADELVFAVGQFDPAIPEGYATVASADSFSLRAVSEIRSLESWSKYLLAVSEGKERARLDQVDFDDAFRIWERHHELLEKLFEADLPHVENTAMSSQYNNALSIIFRFEELAITAVYRSGKCTVVYPDEKKVSSLKRKVTLTIDLVCCDVSSGPLTIQENPLFWLDNPLFAEIRQFEGITYQNGDVVAKKLINRLSKKFSLTIPFDEETLESVE